MKQMEQCGTLKIAKVSYIMERREFQQVKVVKKFSICRSSTHSWKHSIFKHLLH